MPSSLGTERVRNRLTGGWMDGWKQQRRRKNAECVFVFNDGSGIWKIMCAERCWLSREREGAGDLLRLQPRKAMKPRGDAGNRQPVCVYTNTHMCTQVRQLCLDRAPLSVTFFAEVLPGSECSHTFSSAFSPPPPPEFWKYKWHPPTSY